MWTAEVGAHAHTDHMDMCRRAEIGVGLTGFGFLFTFLGVVFFFDKGLLAMGNVSFPVRASYCIANEPAGSIWI